MWREEPGGEGAQGVKTPSPPLFCFGHTWGDWKVPVAGVYTGSRHVCFLPALVSLTPLPPIQGRDLTFRPSGAYSGLSPLCWGDSPQGRQAH